jgi:hypothetical protein
MRLELKHLSNYLPYGINMWDDRRGVVRELSRLNTKSLNNIGKFKPILRRISSLTTEEKHKLEMTDLDRSVHINNIYVWYWGDVNLLLKWHVDIFGLIESGIAIDIDTMR